MKKIIVFSFLIFELYIIYSLWVGFSPNTYVPILKNYQIKTAVLGNNNYTLYMADTPKRQEQGLSNVPNLPETTGMIFLYKKTSKYYFWMKDMKFPLDFVFVNKGEVVDLLGNVSPNTYPNAFTAKVPFDQFIEINGGEIVKSNIAIGQKIELK